MRLREILSLSFDFSRIPDIFLSTQEAILKISLNFRSELTIKVNKTSSNHPHLESCSTNQITTENFSRKIFAVFKKFQSSHLNLFCFIDFFSSIRRFMSFCLYLKRDLHTFFQVVTYKIPANSEKNLNIRVSLHARLCHRDIAFLTFFFA